MKKRLLIILFIVSILLVGIVIIDVGIEASKSDANLTEGRTENLENGSIYSEEKLFERAHQGLTYKSMDSIHGYSSDLETGIKRRAYPGAPPIIPHRLYTEEGIGGKNCLQCHKNGGYVDELKKFTPVTPHPEMVNCRQCHVPIKTTEVFRESDFKKTGFPELKQSALEGSPPMIPHQIQMRENCLSCHAGPSAKKEIRVSHPERVNCRQCHVPNTAKLENIDLEFIRENKEKSK